MTLKQVKQLQPEDEVFWKDPDNNRCSKFIIIQKIQLHGGDIVKLWGQDGSYLECYPHELE